jgi:hypothetical protein
MAKTTKPPLKLIGTEGALSCPDPPANIGKPGRELWQSVMSEYQIEDSGGRAMLVQICCAFSRAEALREEIDRDGEVIHVRGTIKEHPALKHELASRAFVVRGLSRLGLDVEPVRPSAGRPGRQVGWTP